MVIIMKKIKIKVKYIYIIIFAFILLELIFFAFNTVRVRFFPAETSAPAENTVDMNWEELYPVDMNEQDGDETSEENTAVSENKSKISAVFELISEKTSVISGFVGNNSDNFLGHSTINNIGDKTKQITYRGVLFSKNGLQQLENGQIFEPEAKNESYGKEAAVTYKNFNSFLKEQDIPLLYVQPITKYDESGRFNTSINENLDVFLESLEDVGVDVLDLRKNAKADKISVDEAFYKTDHHWKAYMGLWASQNIVDCAKNNYSVNFNENILNTKNFKLKIYKDAMFGSYGDFAGTNWCEYEDHPVYYPKFETSFRIEIPNKEIDNKGDFSVLFNNEKIEEFTNGNANYVYETTCYGNTPLTRITNYSNPNAPRVLMIRDSFALATLPYLACVCSEIDSIDIRDNNGNFNGSVKTYIKEFQPDIVIVLNSKAQPKPIK